MADELLDELQPVYPEDVPEPGYGYIPAPAFFGPPAAGSAGCCIARSGKLDRACSRLYRGQILQENMRWKALAEIYTMRKFKFQVKFLSSNKFE